jgi:uncharacterized membrane protein YraQ (UPF0718 family)
MQRNTVLKIVNPVLGLVVLSQLVTGTLHGVLPRQVFETMHHGGGIVVAAAVLLHVLLNWNWVKATYFRRRPTVAP